MRLKALFLVVLVNASIFTFSARDITSKKASFDDSEPIFNDPFSSATGNDALGAGAIGSGIDGTGLGSLLGGSLGAGAGIGFGVKGGFGVGGGGLGESGFAIGGSLTSGGAKVGGGFRAGLPWLHTGSQGLDKALTSLTFNIMFYSFFFFYIFDK